MALSRRHVAMGRWQEVWRERWAGEWARARWERWGVHATGQAGVVKRGMQRVLCEVGRVGRTDASRAGACCKVSTVEAR